MAEKPPESAPQPAEAASPAQVDPSPIPAEPQAQEPAPRVHSFVEVFKGEFDGLLGSLEKIEGDYAIVRTRDHKKPFPALVTVLLAHVRQSDHTGGR